MPPTVIYIADVNLEDYYEGIQRSINARFHDYDVTFPKYPTTDAEYADLEYYATAAGHVGDGQNWDGIDLERLVV